MMNEDWDLLKTFFPNDWKSLAVDTNALKAVVRSKRANLADLSDVALLKRLKKSKEWLYKLCLSLFRILRFL